MPLKCSYQMTKGRLNGSTERLPQSQPLIVGTLDNFYCCTPSPFSKLQNSGDFQRELKTRTVFNFVKGWGTKPLHVFQHYCLRLYITKNLKNVTSGV